jgi:co-chaperonin GroES (HSP10)
MINDCFLIKPIKGEVKSVSGIVLTAEVSDTPPSRGIVIAAPFGDSYKVKEGDLVYYDKYTGINIKGDLSADDYIVLTEKQILAYVPKGKHNEQI